MKTSYLLSAIIMPVIFMQCNFNNHISDASGTFEVDEVIVSSEIAGKIISLPIEEGTMLQKGSLAAVIDSIPLGLQKAQIEATIATLHQKTLDVRPQVKQLQDQISVQRVQLENAIYERDRTERLVKAHAATTKQLDDQNNQIEVLKKQIIATAAQIGVQKTSVNTQNSTVLSEYKPLRKSIAQVNDQIRRTNVLNPINGTVLTKYAMQGEVTEAGKALYKIGDLSVITLRAYITGVQLAQVKLNQTVKVLVDSTAKTYRTYPGIITWISDKAEFTPKTIQTKEERANLVYAIKIHVKNDGYLKIGMYGEVVFK
ncbi:HlyD family efflux transporter periplasmic adaptor subunit [Chitinophaga silvatica]|uniref:HlyD family efflux transporter periplasmic adaptor subunit n=1 Tax=Chitinophaga silvatica TaxID=2282649 RepID=A0A3E1YI70_9BACT|nr:HlyD family efflux transporter periplasmic adaptor subunit [Chitinophaga silvatica]RFS27046.1 HlyD family efflux transporter periplasmic adaptor subunit [Chitinophaga silvatica]